MKNIFGDLFPEFLSTIKQAQSAVRETKGHLLEVEFLTKFHPENILQSFSTITFVCYLFVFDSNLRNSQSYKTGLCALTSN